MHGRIYTMKTRMIGSYKEALRRFKATKPLENRRMLIVLFRNHRKADPNYKDGKWVGM